MPARLFLFYFKIVFKPFINSKIQQFACIIICHILLISINFHNASKHFYVFGALNNNTNLLIMNKTIGIILLVVGIVMIIWTGFTYTKKEKVIDAGPLQVSADKQKTVNWPPYAGGILIVGGIILLVTGKKTS